MIESCSITVVLRSEKFLKLHYTIQSCCKLLQVSFSFSKSLPNLYRPFYSFKEIFRSSTILLLNKPKSRHSWGDRSFFSSCARIWNSLPLNLRSCLCTTKFKTLLKTYYVTGFQRQILLCLFSFC